MDYDLHNVNNDLYIEFQWNPVIIPAYRILQHGFYGRNKRGYSAKNASKIDFYFFCGYVLRFGIIDILCGMDAEGSIVEAEKLVKSIPVAFSEPFKKYFIFVEVPHCRKIPLQV